MNNEEFKESNPHSIGKGKVFLGKSILKVTKETYKVRNVNFHKFTKGLMLGMLSHNEYKTLNLECKTYQIELRLSIVPGEIVIPKKIITPEKKIILAKKKIEEAKKMVKGIIGTNLDKKKLIKVVK